MCGEWRLLKYVEEAEFGPDAGLNTVLITGSLESKLEGLQESCKWMSKECALGLLSEAKPGGTRIGLYAFIGLLKPDLPSPALPSQEYPPGITLVPMKSRTLQPFRTTNLVVVRATDAAGGSACSDCVTSGDALLIDPGCCSQVNEKSFSMEKFEASCGINFMLRWAVVYLQARSSPAILAATTLAGGLAIAYALKRKSGD